MNLDDIISKADGLLESALDDEVVLLNIADGDYFGMNAVASRIWSWIESPMSVREVVERLLAEFEVDRERCETELMACLDQLQTSGLISVAQADSQ